MTASPIKHFIFLFILAYGSAAWGAIQIPDSLNKADRASVLRILGFGTSSKMLSDPYPLGGYTGLEIGISVENLPAEDLGRLGSGLTVPQQDITYHKFSIGKGLYNNVDLFLQFTPYSRQEEFAQYGGMIRWGFYQAGFFPVNASLITHVNSVNIGNRLTARSYGIDILTGINVENLALCAGFGIIEATGTFMGGPGGLTDTGSLASEAASGIHTLVGATIHLSTTFVSLQIDRYENPVVSGKFGLRF